MNSATSGQVFRKHMAARAALGLLALAGGCAMATEGGGSTYSPGVENFLVGAVPPPGLYVLEYATVYRATRLNDKAGNAIPIPGFKVSAIAAATRLVWSTNKPLLGGTLVMHAIFPIVDLNIEAAGANQHRTGLGDITAGFGTAWHHSPQLHSVLDVDFVLPTGSYGRANLANLGRNYVSIQPLYALSYIDPKGFNGDFKATFNFNRTNEDTGYRSGNEFILDYSAGWGLGNGWTIGAGGYWYEQFTDDKVNGATVPDARARGFAIGPSVKYDNGKGWFLTAKLQRETSARNRPQGTAFWLKTLISF